MFARMTTAHANAANYDEALAEVENTFLPAAQGQPGYRGFVLLADRDNNQLIGISLWETEADMQASGGESGYYQERLAHFGQLLAHPATTAIYTVAVHES